jgi:hypothetical protein
MGQQQLLLLVLGIVIVGLAVVAGINAFSENRKKANADAMVNDAVRIASDIQAWVLKPEAFGGLGDEGGDYSSVTFNDIGYSTTSGSSGTSKYSTVNGEYELSGSCEGSNVSTPTASGTAEAGTDVYISGSSSNTGNEVCVLVQGTDEDDVATETYIGTN